MDIKILDSWLREVLDTNAKPEDIARCLSLCGPSIEKVEKTVIEGKTDYIYNIEVTTNRVDIMSVCGIAREAKVILPRFGFKAKIKTLEMDPLNQSIKNPVGIKLITDPRLENRLIGIIMEVESLGQTPSKIKNRLESTGIRSLNTTVDITNYVMTEIGHPAHVFDYDLVTPLMKVRESKSGEVVQSFDDKIHKLPGGDIVFENEKHEIIDLPGIIGTKNSVVNENTKRILFFIDNNNPVMIRRTSMKLGIRTVAATLNEKGVDPELAEIALRRGVFLYKKLLNAKVVSKVNDIYTNKPKLIDVVVSHPFIEKSLGIKINKSDVVNILNSLEFKVKTKTDSYQITPPSYRANDIKIKEDVVEEIARIFGYFNLPSKLMTGEIPEKSSENIFGFEEKLKNILKELSGTEVYNYSLVSKESLENADAVKLLNPLGREGEYLRVSLKPGLVQNAIDNSAFSSKFHLFELGNVYIPRKDNLPDEVSILAGILVNHEYREAAGVVEALLLKLNISFTKKISERPGFINHHFVEIISGKKTIGCMGILEGTSYFYFEFYVRGLIDCHKEYPTFKPLSKYPPQVESITFIMPEKTVVSEVIEYVKKINNLISVFELTDIYEDAYTFRVEFINPERTLTNTEVEVLRNKLINGLNKKFSTTVK